MRPSPIPLLLPALLLLFVSCSSEKTLLISDPYFSSLAGKELASAWSGRLEERIYPAPPSTTEIEALVAELRPRTLLFSPLYSRLAEGIEALRPELRVLAPLPAYREAAATLAVRIEDEYREGATGSILILLGAEGEGRREISRSLREMLAAYPLEERVILEGEGEGEAYPAVVVLLGAAEEFRAAADRYPEALLLLQRFQPKRADIRAYYLDFDWIGFYRSRIDSDSGQNLWKIVPLPLFSSPAQAGTVSN